MVPNCGPHEQLGLIKQRGRRCLLEESKRDQMMGPGKKVWEIRNLGTALRNPMQALRFFTANVGWSTGGQEC